MIKYIISVHWDCILYSNQLEHSSSLESSIITSLSLWSSQLFIITLSPIIVPWFLLVPTHFRARLLLFTVFFDVSLTSSTLSIFPTHESRLVYSFLSRAFFGLVDGGLLYVFLPPLDGGLLYVFLPLLNLRSPVVSGSKSLKKNCRFFRNS